VVWWQICYRLTMRIVLDTNVFIGACLGIRVCNAVVRAALIHKFMPLMGAALFSEYEVVLARAALFADCRLDSAERHELLDIFLAGCEWTRVYFLWRPNLQDESDNHLFELAVAGGADFIVSRNLRDLENPGLRFPGLQVLSPEDFLKEL
jgi:putative PIN family toxin of toxin-antitoxin system